MENAPLPPNTSNLSSRSESTAQRLSMLLGLIRPSQDTRRQGEEDELVRARLEKVYAAKLKSRKAVIVATQDGPQVLPVSKLLKYGSMRRQLLQSVVGPHSGGEVEVLVEKVKARFDKAGVQFSDVVVRWNNLTVIGHVLIKVHKEPGLLGMLKDDWQAARAAFTGMPPKGSRRLYLLHEVSGVLRPGRFTLLLGPPACGKTTLMRTLAGQMKREKGLQISYDELTYNGFPMDKFVPERASAYISQHDFHFGELTVRETLDFSARCSASELRASTIAEVEKREQELGITPDPSLAAYMTALCRAGRQNLITDMVLKTLGLDICSETVVGNNMLRGISGGQKKRVTSGEMLVGSMRVLMADEISTGLDSAITFDICKALRSSCHLMQCTMLVALLQPAPETFDLFDDLLVMSGGKVVFQGPPDWVLPFFEGLGLSCPDMKGVADFLQEVNTMTNQKLFWSGDPAEYHYVSAQYIADAFYASEHGKAVMKELSMPPKEGAGGHGELPTQKYGKCVAYLLRANMRRQLTLWSRNTPFIIIRLCQCALMGFALGTLFLSQSKGTVQDAQMFQGVAFFSVLYQMVGAMPAAVNLIDRLPVYYKQRDAHFYPAWCFALPELLLQYPLTMAETWIWTLMVYFMVGFVTSPRLLVFWGFTVVQAVWSQSLFLASASICRSHAITVAVQSFLMLILLVSSGFIIGPGDMPGGWIAAFWANPIAAFVKGVFINEFTSSDWSMPAGNGLTVGAESLVTKGFPTDYYFVWIGLFAWGIGSTCINMLVFFAACTYISALEGTRAVPAEVVLERELAEGGTPEQQKELEELNAFNGAPTNGVTVSIGQVGNADAGAGKSDGDAAAAVTNSGDVEEGGKAGKHNGQIETKSAIPFKPLTMTFRDVVYSVPMPKGSLLEPATEGPHSGNLVLLKGISGSFRPGVLTALMGASGAGKTTLMDVLAGRKTAGLITGEMMVNGFPKQTGTFARVSGYVEQLDVHLPEATVHEAVQFSARLRLPTSVTREVEGKFVEEVLSLVELGGIRNAQIGMPGESGLSVEQRKRLTIAVELVSNPSIVFMDEPTSGLDARAASIVMRAVRNTVNTGRTVVCTVHQPALDIFLAFDEMLLLKRGGETIFNGPLGKGACELISYLQAIPGVPHIKPRYNPSNWMLEVSAPEFEEDIGVDFAQIFQGSDLERSTHALIDSLSKPLEGDTDLHYSDLGVSRPMVQARELLHRNFQQYARKHEYNVTRLIITFVIGVCFGTLFRHQGSNTTTFQGVLNVAGALFMSVSMMGMQDCFMVQDTIVTRRSIYYREHPAGMYSTGPYLLAEFLVEVPYLIMQTVIYSLLVYWLIGFEADAKKFWWFFLIMFLTLMQWVYFGVFCVHITPTQQLSHAMAGFCFGFVSLFCGFLKPRPSIPKGWIWMYWINPLSYTLYALVVGQMGDINTLMVTTGASSQSMQTVSDFLEAYFGWNYDFRWWCVLILCGYILFFLAMATLALTKARWQSR